MLDLFSNYNYIFECFCQNDLIMSLKILNNIMPRCCLFYREKQRLEKELLKSKQTVDQLATTATVQKGIREDIDIQTLSSDLTCIISVLVLF